MSIAPSALHGFRDYTFHVLGIGQIAVDRDGFATLGDNGGDDAVGGLLAGAVVDGDRRALGREPRGDFGTDAFGCAGHERNFSFESLGHHILHHPARRRYSIVQY
ncbi:hypothetical protein ACVWZ6_002039 [Bradyrhizobium sp. GM6.1]